MQAQRNCIDDHEKDVVIKMLTQFLHLGPCREVVSFIGVLPEIKIGAQFDVLDSTSTGWYVATIYDVSLITNNCIVHYRNWKHSYDETIFDFNNSSRLQLLGTYTRNFCREPGFSGRCYENECTCVIKCNNKL